MRSKDIKNSHVLRISIGIAFIVLILAAGVASAAEFVLFKGAASMVETDKGFDYFYRLQNPIPSTWPSNWISPADYWNGVWNVRIQLKSRPAGTTSAFTLQPCIWQHDADGVSTYVDELEICGTLLKMSTPATYEFKTAPLSSWWQKASGAKKVDLSRPDDIKRMGFALAQYSPACFISSYPVSPECWDQRYKYIPFDYHITIVAVSKGATFSGWSNYPISGGTTPSLPGLGISISESPDPLVSSGTSKVKFHVTSGTSAVSGAALKAVTTCGSLSSYSGTTNSYGDISVTFTAPAVTSQKTCTISATASKTGYSGGSGSDLITVYPVSSPPPPQVTTGIIQNGGFESGTTSWLFYTSGTGAFTVVSPGYGGTTKAANLALKSSGTNIQLSQKGITLAPKTGYRLSFVAKSSSGHDMTVAILKHVSPYTNFGLKKTFYLTTSWQTFTVDFTTAGFSSTVNDARLMFWLAPFATAGEIYNIDNVNLVKI